MKARLDLLKGGINTANVLTTNKHMVENYTRSVGELVKVIYTSGRRGRPPEGVEAFEVDFLRPGASIILKSFLSSAKAYRYKGVLVWTTNLCGKQKATQHLTGKWYQLSIDGKYGPEVIFQTTLQ